MLCPNQPWKPSVNHCSPEALGPIQGQSAPREAACSWVLPPETKHLTEFMASWYSKHLEAWGVLGRNPAPASRPLLDKQSG